MLHAIQDNYTYQIVRKIADGGMGSVYEAVQHGVDGFQKIVAIKTLLPKLSENRKFVDMFVQEAKLVANLVHENIVQIYQLGRMPEGYYIVMEYVHGLSLHEFIRFHNSVLHQLPPVELCVFISSRIARGLAYAHSRVDRYSRPLNIVHRDVCPNNIMITTEGLPKLADFGIAIVSSDMFQGVQQLMGKLTYMSPQQAQREPVDFRADIFALGAAMFELLTGERIRRGKTEKEFMDLAKSGFIDWTKLPKDIPDEVRDVLQFCLAGDLDGRYESTNDLATSLEYIIYKDGYGPTIQTLEEYLRKHLPYLYRKQPQQNILTRSSKVKFTPVDSEGVTARILSDDSDGFTD